MCLVEFPISNFEKTHLAVLDLSHANRWMERKHDEAKIEALSQVFIVLSVSD
jgi:hypothetical protein